LLISPNLSAAPITLSYSWSLGDVNLEASGPGPISLSQTKADDGSWVMIDHGNGTATFTVAPGGTVDVPETIAPGDTFTIPMGTVLRTPKPSVTGGDFSFNALLPLTLKLGDIAAGESIPLTVTAALGGKVSPEGANIGMSGLWWSGWPDLGSTIGGHFYSVIDVIELKDETDPNLSHVYAVLSADSPVYWLFRDGQPIALPVNVPEPSGLVLAGCALSLLGLRRWRRGKDCR
jgi:hypothetical protein